MTTSTRRQQIGALLMAIWLCGWIGLTLFHGLSHAAHADEHTHAPCVVCQLLHQPAPATIDTKFALRVAPTYERVFVIALDTQAHVPSSSPQPVVPRGPPAFSFS